MIPEKGTRVEFKRAIFGVCWRGMAIDDVYEFDHCDGQWLLWQIKRDENTDGVIELVFYKVGDGSQHTSMSALDWIELLLAERARYIRSHRRG
jgi:hypothetical protein